jgi:hypothetical protein
MFNIGQFSTMHKVFFEYSVVYLENSVYLHLYFIPRRFHFVVGVIFNQCAVHAVLKFVFHLLKEKYNLLIISLF